MYAWATRVFNSSPSRPDCADEKPFVACRPSITYLKQSPPSSYDFGGQPSLRPTDSRLYGLPSVAPTLVGAKDGGTGGNRTPVWQASAQPFSKLSLA